MRTLLNPRVGLLALAAFFSSALHGEEVRPAASTLWYDKPASHWLEALPVGNGRMGAMVFGGVTNERIQFNEQTLWTGTNASQKITGHNTGDGSMGDYQPFGDVFLRFPAEHAACTDYRRELDLHTATATTRYRVDGITFTREVFASHPDRVVVVRLSADKPASLSFQIELKDVQRRQLPPVATTASEAGKLLSFTGRLSRPPKVPTTDLRWNNMAYQASLRVLADGGKVSASGGGLSVSKADAVTLLLAAATDYDTNPRKNFRGEAPAPKINAALGQAGKKPFARLFADHLADHQTLFGRMSLDLGGHERNSLPTDQRLIQYTAGARDNALEALLFQFGRYVTIASVRPGGLPANLQGLWNDNPAPAWYSGYTHNMNVQMNNWLTETANLPECAQPLFDWIDNIALGTKLNPDPKLRTELGWVMYSTHNPLGGNSGWAFHRPGSAWLSQHLWEHFAFSADKEFLRKRAYPHLRELARMWDARLINGPDGKLVTPDGWSPEHAPVRGKDGKITIKEGDRTPLPGVSYDQQIIWDLFTNFIEASQVLGVDDELRAHLTERRSRLLGPKIGRWGQIQEWMEDVDDPKLVYRHIGHLFALHPGRQISPLTTPDLAKAAGITLDANGEKSVGWSRAWKLCFRARLHDGNGAAKLVRSVLEYVPAKTNASGTHPNLFGAGPPFQMDANFGYTAGVAEMLLQSHLRSEDGRREIHLLPAIPDTWPSGEVTGLRARDGFTVDQKWQDGKLISAAITSKSGRPLRVRYQNKTVDFEIPAGSTKTFVP